MKKKKFKAVELNFLDEETIMKLREWRNQDFVRLNMFHQEIIGEKEHIQWVERTKADPDRHVFLFYLDGEPFGVETYIYDPEKNHVEVGGYLIDTEFQDLGYGLFLSYFSQDIAYRYLKYENTYAEILKKNTRSAGVSRYLGEIPEIKENAREINGVFHDVLISRCKKSDWLDSAKADCEKIVLKFVEAEYEVTM